MRARYEALREADAPIGVAFEAQLEPAPVARLRDAIPPENVTLPGLDFKVALDLSYEDAPLGEIAYVDPTGAPILLCVIDNGEADVPLRSEERDQFSLASWSRKGHSYLVIGRIPEQRVSELAHTLVTRFLTPKAGVAGE